MARYTISPGGGLLGPTMLPFGPATASANPSTGAMHPSGKFVVLTTATHEVVSLRIDAAAMTEIGRAPTESPFSNTPWLTFHPNGKFLYLTSVRDTSVAGVKSGIVIYSFDAATGAIRVIGHYDNASGLPSFRVLVRPAGDFLLTAEPQEIVSLRIDPVTGALGQRQALSTVGIGSFPFPQAFLDEATFVTSPVAGSPAVQSSLPYALNVTTGGLTMGTALPVTFSGPQANDGITYSVVDGHAAAAVGTNAVFFDWDATAKKSGPAAQVGGALRVHHVELIKVPR
jgi:hypothetical protein